MKKGARYKRIALKLIGKEIHKAKQMVDYTKGFDDKTAMGRWLMVLFEYECLYKELETAFDLIEKGKTNREIKKALKTLSKNLFMNGV